MIFLRVPGDILDNTLYLLSSSVRRNSVSACYARKTDIIHLLLPVLLFSIVKQETKFPQGKKLLFYAAKGFKPLIMSWVQRTLS